MDNIFRWLYMLHDGWLFAAVIIFVSVVLSQVMREAVRKQVPEGKKPFFPYMVFYYGEVYEWRPRMSDSIFPTYLAYYGAIVTIMGGLEWFVEGSPGIVVKLELWGLVGGILGYWLFAFLGTLVGVFLAGVSVFLTGIFHKGEKVSVAFTIGAGLSIGFFLGAFVGLLAGMSFFSYNFSLLYELDLWAGVIVVAIPVLIVFVELVYRVNKERNVGEFVEECHGKNVRVIIAAPYTFEDEDEALPGIVIPRDPKARMPKK